MGKLTLILGGARSGKSSYAEDLAITRGGQVAYIATAEALDEEMEYRIINHKKERPNHWKTYEIPRGVGQIFREHAAQTDLVILDCLTMLVSNHLLYASEDGQEPDEQTASSVVNIEMNDLKAVIQDCDTAWIVVSNEVGLGLVPPYPLGRLYRDLLGRVNKQLAAIADEVYLMVAGIPVPIDHFRT
jgi:adenosylcobinamide kinase/adenosylcobinamide-phosphate guanylyltransferase